MQLRRLKTPLSQTRNQQGFVAIITASLVIVIITAVVIGFTVIARREQQQVRDRQQSAQAVYAAESGVNFAVKQNIASSTVCNSGQPNGDGGPSGSLDPLQTISIPCLLVNSAPTELLFDEISRERPTVFQLKTPVTELTFAWSDPKGASNFAVQPKFLPARDWGATTGVLEVVIYPLDSVINTSNISLPGNPSLVEGARTFYLYPQAAPPTGTGQINWNNDDGKVAAGNCHIANLPKPCLVRISDIPNTGLGGKGYVVRLRSIYNSVALQINGKNGVATADVPLEGVQKMVDSTGKSNDVLRRIQVRLPFRDAYNLPIYAVETLDDLCKLQTTAPSPTGSDDPCPP